MRAGGRAGAAMEILADVAEHHRPASEALKDWGRTHRFAGSGDRAAIGNLIYDVLRKRSSFAHRMGEETPRALVLAALGARGLSSEDIARIASEPHGPGALTEEEARLLAQQAQPAPPWIAGDYPEWLHPSFERAFGAEAVAEGAALSARAPVDLRVNTLKTSRDTLLRALEKFGGAPGRLSPLCVRIGPAEGDGRTPDVEAEPIHAKGWFEVQDEGSQMAALLAGAKPGMQLLDLCAGAGGKTLALAAAMGNKGQIFATDSDRQRLRPIFDRLKRAGVRNVQVLPADEPRRVEALVGRMDLVFLDTPCSGSGAWRRRPDAKWRLTPKALAARLNEQRAVLEKGAAMVKPGGRLHYVTCSVLPEENMDQIAAFLAEHPDFASEPLLWPDQSSASDGIKQAAGPLLLTPRRHATDGFFIASLRRTA